MEIQKNAPYKPTQQLQLQQNNKANQQVDLKKVDTQKQDLQQLAGNKEQTKMATAAAEVKKTTEGVALTLSNEGKNLAAGAAQKPAEAPAEANKVSYASAVGNGQNNMKSQLENMQKKLADNAASPRVNSLFR